MKITNENIDRHLKLMSDKDIEDLLWNGVLNNHNEMLCKDELESRHKERNESKAPSTNSDTCWQKKKENTEPTINIHSLDPSKINETINDRGDTALMVAARSGDVQLIRQLLEMGADRLIENDWGNTAQSIAINSGHNDVAHLLGNVEKNSEESRKTPIDNNHQEEIQQSTVSLKPSINKPKNSVNHSVSRAPEGMVPVEQYAQEKQLSVNVLIEKIREGDYTGRLVSGKWFIQSEGLQKPTTKVSKTDKNKKMDKNDWSEYMRVKLMFFGFISGFLFGVIVWALTNLENLSWAEVLLSGIGGGFLASLAYHSILIRQLAIPVAVVAGLYFHFNNPVNLDLYYKYYCCGLAIFTMFAVGITEAIGATGKVSDFWRSFLYHPLGWNKHMGVSTLLDE